MTDTSTGFGFSIIGIAINNFAAQLFFTRRCYRLFGSRLWVIIGLGSISVLCFGAGLAFGVRVIIEARAGFSFTAIFPKVRGALRCMGKASSCTQVTIPYSMLLYASALLDIVMSVAISWRLLSAKAGFNKAMDSLLTRVTRLTISSAAITTIVAVTCAAIYIAGGKAALGGIALFPALPHLYAFCVR